MATNGTSSTTSLEPSALLTSLTSVKDNNVALNNCAHRPRHIHRFRLTIPLDLQNTNRLAAQSWEDRVEGPRHDPVWTSFCKGMCL